MIVSPTTLLAARRSVMDPLANPDAIIQLTVNRYLSLTQGKMVTTGAGPDVTTTLVQGGGRVTRLSNGAFEVNGGDPQGRNPVVIQFEVLPPDTYAAVGLIVKNLHNVPDGGNSWDQVVYPGGVNDNKVIVRDRVPVPQGAPISYELYVLIKPKAAAADFPVDDIGLIDPLFTNR
jgi:hypothetical protein